MKKLFLVMAGVSILAAATVNAKSLPSVAAKLPANLKEEITRNLDYPSFAAKNQVEGEAWMKVCVTEESKVRIVDLSATNQELGVFVRKQISNLQVETPGCKAGEVFYLKVTFDLLTAK